jgi:multiple sugar transport system permease protein
MGITYQIFGMRPDKLFNRLLVYCGSVVVLFYILGPFLWLVSSSFQPEQNLLDRESSMFPTEWDFTAYRELLTGFLYDETSGIPYQARIFLRSLLNSLIVAGGVAVLSILIGSVAAYPLARMKFKGRNFLMFFILGTRLIPAIALAVPFYLMVKAVGMNDRLETLIVINLSFILPYVIWLLQAYYRSIPMELEEAARIDGCSRLGTLYRIILPLSLPGLVSTGILAFLLSWGDFFFALILTQSQSSFTSTVVASMFATDVDVKYVSIICAGVLSVIPPVSFALIFQRYIMSGLLSGAAKG